MEESAGKVTLARSRVVSVITGSQCPTCKQPAPCTKVKVSQTAQSFHASQAQLTGDQAHHICPLFAATVALPKVGFPRSVAAE